MSFRYSQDRDREFDGEGTSVKSPTSSVKQASPSKLTPNKGYFPAGLAHHSSHYHRHSKSYSTPDAASPSLEYSLPITSVAEYPSASYSPAGRHAGITQQSSTKSVEQASIVPTRHHSLGPLASPSSRPRSTASRSLSAGRFEFTTDRSPLQKLERELQTITSEGNSLNGQSRGTLTRSLSQKQVERLRRSATVTSRLTVQPASPVPANQTEIEETSPLEEYNRSTIDTMPMLSDIPEPKTAMNDSQTISRSSKDKTTFFGLYHRRHSSSSSASSNSTGKLRAKRQKEKVPMSGQVARLTIEDSELQDHKTDETVSEDPDLAYNKTLVNQDPTLYTPKLAIKCGPMLRYAGLRRDGINPRSRRGSTATAKEEREVWRGSIMIVTEDNGSVYDIPPRARLFVQPIETISGNNNANVMGEDRRGSNVSTVWRIRDGEKQKKYKDINGVRIAEEQGFSFWRFLIEIELNDKQTRIAYRINHGPTIAFWVPGRGETMNVMFHSCNGFSLGVNPANFSGPDPLWRNVLQSHKEKPFHVMIGGGDQVYNDCISEKTTLFAEWVKSKNPLHKHSQAWSEEMSEELEDFYLYRYCEWFSQGLFGIANCQIPMVNMWDDHDIIDGFGSYPSHFNGCDVFIGLGEIALKYYLLFQHQSLPEEHEGHDSSWIIGASPGPYIRSHSRSVFMFLGRRVALLGLDCRTERERDVVITPDTYDIIFDRARREIIKGETKHLVVLLGVPIAYPRLVWLENLLTSRIMDPFKALARMNIFGGLLNNFDGGVEILDDLDDHWTAKNHKAERNWLIKNLQAIAAEKSVRITILGGDVHLSGIGQFYSNPSLGLSKENDHRYMANVISSAIVNAPPPNAMADVLNKRNKIHHLDDYTDEDMYPIFLTDVDGKPRNNKRLMPRRNYCTLSEYDPAAIMTSPVVTNPVKRTSFFKSLGKSSKKNGSLKNGNPDETGETASVSSVAPECSLEVTIRVEVNCKVPTGATKPYSLLIPSLLVPGYDQTSAMGGAPV